MSSHNKDVKHSKYDVDKGQTPKHAFGIKPTEAGHPGVSRKRTKRHKAYPLWLLLYFSTLLQLHECETMKERRGV